MPINLKEPHSRQYLDDCRLSWWNQDYIRLLLERARVTEARTIADVGIGQRHWSELIVNNLDLPATLYGIDKEACWLEAARQRFLGHQKVQAFKPIQSDAASIPLENDSIGMATCQTVLMHCHDPEAVAREMMRVVRPGGTLMVVEPVNILNRMQIFELATLGFCEDHLDIIRFWAHYHAYLRRDRHVDHDIGARLFDLFTAAGATDITLFQNEAIISGSVDDRPGLEDYEYLSPDIKAAFSGDEGERALYEKGLAAFDRLNRQFGAVSGTYSMRQSLMIMIALK